MRVLNFGSLNIDHVYRVDRFVQPGETKAVKAYEVFAGGKGLNQSIALARAGLRVAHAGKVGPEGDFLIKVLKQAGVETASIGRSPLPTGHAIIQVDDEGHNCILIHGGANRDITEAFIQRVLEVFDKGDILVLQNEIAMPQRILELAHAKGMTLVLNPSPFEPSIAAWPLALVDIFVLNETEAAGLARGLALLDAERAQDAREAARALAARFSHALVVVTLGAEGALAIRDGSEYLQPAFKVNALDTTAAGDTFLGYLVAGIAEGCSIPDALKLAAQAAAICVTRKGASSSIPRRDELEQGMTH
ncbi:MAG: ribokinase [Spirochaetaceae bacterium]|nr:ribokinase [Spirochaetaceae bacterium]